MGRRLPALTRFYEKYEAQRDRFEILAFHSASVKTFEELDARMKSIIAGEWGGKDVPFPILLDATGTTLRNFSIRALGTHVLIDPAGKVVKGEGEKTIEKALQALLEKPDREHEEGSSDAKAPD